LDQNLWSAALQAGVDARQQQTVLSISGSGPFRITAQDEIFESQAVINSTGRWSNLSNRNSANGHTPKWIGLKAHFAESNFSPSVDLYFFEGGYCGVQPVNNSHLNVCAMVRSDVAASLLAVFDQHPALRDRSQTWRQTTNLVSTSPLLFTAPQPTDGNNILFAGDAAGFLDPFVGDGISLALRSGKLAAECLQPFFDQRLTLSEAADNYRRHYERKFLPVFRTSSGIRRLFALPYPARAALLFLFERAPALTRYLVRKTR
jgi:flavin-dependent dehydrogenase